MDIIRKTDTYGSGLYQAPRGKRKHNGIDIKCGEHDYIFSVNCGEVTKIGYPYNPNDKKRGHLRYVQVTNPYGYDVRYFYIKPKVQLGQIIEAGDSLGTSQDLQIAYPSITPHMHFEVKKDGEYIDPYEFLASIVVM